MKKSKKELLTEELKKFNNSRLHFCDAFRVKQRKDKLDRLCDGIIKET